LVEQPTTAVRASYIACDQRTDTERALPRWIWQRDDDDDDGVRVTRSAAIAGGPAERLAASSTMQPEPGPLPPAAAVVATRRRRRHYHFARVLLRGGRCNAPVDDSCGSTTRVFFTRPPEQRDARAASANGPVVRSLPPRSREDSSSIRRGRCIGHIRRDEDRG